jgi:membrane associated rhomboid family serine protease
MTDDPRRAIADYSATIRRQFQQALALSLLAALVLGAVFLLQPLLAPLRPWALVPQQAWGLVGVATAPLLHGSFGHLASNAFSVVVLGTLAGTLYPAALLRALPLVWLGSGLGTWLIATGGQHIGASGVTHGLMFFIATLGLLRRDRSAIAAMMIAMLLFGGMLLSILPQEPGISWEYHLSGAGFGLLSALLWRRLDPAPPRPRYSWEDEAEPDPGLESLEPPRPDDVPVLWQRPVEPRGQVLEFRRRESPPNAGANPDSVT